MCGAPLANILRSERAWFLATLLGSFLKYLNNSSACVKRCYMFINLFIDHLRTFHMDFLLLVRNWVPCIFLLPKKVLRKLVEVHIITFIVKINYKFWTFAFLIVFLSNQVIHLSHVQPIFFKNNQGIGSIA